MYHPGHPVGTPIADELGGVGVKHSDIGELVAAKAIGGIGEELTRPLDSQEVDLGRDLSLLTQEGALAGADFELKRQLGLGKPVSGIEPAMVKRRQVGLGQAHAIDDK